MRTAEPGDALAALERLLRHGVLNPEEARLAARLITGDPDLEFPPPAPPPAPSAEGEAASPAQ